MFIITCSLPGSIQYAECSQSTDAQNIMSEIGRRALNDVDFAIHVLLTAGMSTPALRKIALAGVDIEHAAYSEITAAVTMLGPFDVLTFSHMVFDLFYTKNELTNGELQALAIFFRLLLLLLLWKSEIDDRFFLLKVLTKAVGFLLIMLLAVCCIAILKGTSPLFSWLLLSNVVMAFVVLLGFLGIEGTAKIPCGLQILQIFFARGTKVFASCRTVEPVHLQNFYQSRSTILCAFVRPKWMLDLWLPVVRFVCVLADFFLWFHGSAVSATVCCFASLERWRWLFRSLWPRRPRGYFKWCEWRSHGCDSGWRKFWWGASAI